MGNYRGELVDTIDERAIESISLEKAYANCLEKGIACAIYKLPKSESWHFIVDLNAGTHIDRPNLEEIGEGFVFHPFSSDNHQPVFIKKDIHIVKKNDYDEKLEIFHSTKNTDELKQTLFYRKSTNKISINAEGQKANIIKSSDSEKESFIALVKKTITEIKKKSFQKAVITRVKDIEITKDFNEFELFSKLSSIYKNAFIYLTHIPRLGTWIGATPETLIRIDKNRQFETAALAATQAKKDDLSREETTWSQKDIEEQAMVSRYIINCFKKIRLREFEEVGPRTHVSGNLVHLKTDYKVDMDQVGFPQLGTVMLDLLHPTSAVCGMPKESSMKFIEENEGFDREFFSGYLGPVNILDETNIFVNLRCMKLEKDVGRLYAGAGIISNSIPEKEWDETEIKLDTLINVLKKLH